jgi:hypothetical protein
VANWTVMRVDINPTGGDVELTCLPGAQPWKVTMLDTDTGNQSVTTLCVDPSLEPCSNDGGVLKLLHDAGYTPNDFNTECGF